METCRFRSSYGGDLHCRESQYHYGFCRFHFDCYLKGEILANGQINERLAEQNRRRAINFHGLPLPGSVYVGDAPDDRQSR